jgi:hypothetical protein
VMIRCVRMRLAITMDSNLAVECTTVQSAGVCTLVGRQPEVCWKFLPQPRNLEIIPAEDGVGFGQARAASSRHPRHAGAASCHSRLVNFPPASACESRPLSHEGNIHRSKVPIDSYVLYREGGCLPRLFSRP